MSFNKNLVVVAITLALIVASYGAAALCEDKTGIQCDSNDVCMTKCKETNDHYNGGRCTADSAVGDTSSCVCWRECSTPPTAALGKPATATKGRRGMGMLN